MSINVAHHEWVRRLVTDLRTRGITAVWDLDIQSIVSAYCSIDPNELPLCREISRIFPLLCDAFIPIITPSYLERIGVLEGEQVDSMPYGVVFEEWQGACVGMLQGFVALIPLVRGGRAHQLNLSQLVPFFVLDRHLIDMRSESTAAYNNGLEKLVQHILDVDISRNRFSQIELDVIVDAYVQWCRSKFKNRRATPVDVWPFHTGAANEFLGDFGVVTRASRTPADLNVRLRHWTSELRALHSKSKEPLKYSDLTEFTSLAFRGVDQDEGWRHFDVVAEFAAKMLDSDKLEGDVMERAKALTNTGFALREIAVRRRSIDGLERAVVFIKSALHIVPCEVNPELWLTAELNLADAIRAKAEIQPDKNSLRESESHYERVVQIARKFADERREALAMTAISDIRVLLAQ